MADGYGIDFGTTNSLLAHYDGRSMVPLMDAEVNRPHPSIVWYSGDGVVVGREAKRYINTYGDQPGHTFVRSVKRVLGVEDALEILGEKRPVYQVAKEVFKHLKDDAVRRGVTQTVGECVVSVPIYFDGRRRAAIRSAAEAAGLHVKAFVHEPFAAVVAYLHRTGELAEERLEPKNLLVFDWGGGTLDITLVRVSHDSVAELAVGALADRAGDDFDAIVKRHAMEGFQRAYGLDPAAFLLRAAARDRLAEEAELRKIDLSSRQKVTVDVARFYAVRGADRQLEVELDRLTFERYIQPDVDKAMAEVDRVVRASGKSDIEIDHVLMIGGTSRIPLVNQAMRARFGVRVSVPTNADSIIAEGGALIAYHGWRPQLAKGVTVMMADGTYCSVFEAGTVLVPELAAQEITFFCTDPREGRAQLVICEGNGNFGGVSHTKGILSVPVRRHLYPSVFERIKTSFRFDQDLVLHVRGHGVIEGEPRSASVYDLCFGLKFRGSSVG